MKKFWILAIILVVVFALAACGSKDDDTPVETPASNISDVIDVPIDNNDGDEEVNNNQPEPPANGGGDEEEEEEEEERVPVEVPARPADVAYSMSTDVEFQNMELETRGASEDVLTTEYLIGAGSLSFRIIENPRGGVALRMTNREENWHGVDIITPELNLDTSAHSYQLTVIGNVSEAGNINLSGGDAPHATLFSHNTPAGDFTVTFTITEAIIENLGSRGHLRIGAAHFGNIDIFEIEVKQIALVVPPPPAEVPTRPANVLYSLSTDEPFQSIPMGMTGGGELVLDPTPYLQNAGSPMLEIVANPNGGNAIRVFNRDADWHTIDLMLENMEWTDAEYTILVRGVVENPPEGTTVDIMGIQGGWTRFNAPGEENAGVPLVGTSFETTAVVSRAILEAAGGNRVQVRFAIGGEGGQANYTIHEIVITRN
jgi:predicted small lipoprotein YifL